MAVVSHSFYVALLSQHTSLLDVSIKMNSFRSLNKAGKLRSVIDELLPV